MQEITNVKGFVDAEGLILEKSGSGNTYLCRV